jgi:S1-C subfamily serine protease
MKLKLAIIGILSVASFGQAQRTKPLTQKETCSRFMPTVVRIDVAGGNATSFIVSPDGWIVTAAHYVFDPGTREQRTTFAVMLPDGSTDFGKLIIDRDSFLRDFALLKVEKTNLPYLELGTETEVSPGSEIAIIGYPFSAQSPYSPSITTKFCMSGMVTATDHITHQEVKINAVYFQGPVVKGLSGSPIISRETGHVIGIQSAKLAGISTALDETRRRLEAGKASGFVRIVGGVDIADIFIGLINDLDRHLANGLGSATGAADAALALSKAKRNYGHQQPQRH